jgi:hypothetical protein
MKCLKNNFDINCVRQYQLKKNKYLQQLVWRIFFCVLFRFLSLKLEAEKYIFDVGLKFVGSPITEDLLMHQGINFTNI